MPEIFAIPRARKALNAKNQTAYHNAHSTGDHGRTDMELKGIDAVASDIATMHHVQNAQQLLSTGIKGVQTAAAHKA